MFAVVANGIQTICRTQSELNRIIAIYPYPKFQKCRDETQAREWLRQNARNKYPSTFVNYGETTTNGYATVEYFIGNNCVYYNIDTSKLGNVKLILDDSIKADMRYNMIKLKIENLILNDSLIMHHVTAIHKILRVIGNFVDVNIVVPDISIYLAITNYTGTAFTIKSIKKDIAARLGAVAFTVK